MIFRYIKRFINVFFTKQLRQLLPCCSQSDRLDQDDQVWDQTMELLLFSPSSQRELWPGGDLLMSKARHFSSYRYLDKKLVSFWSHLLAPTAPQAQYSTLTNTVGISYQYLSTKNRESKLHVLCISVFVTLSLGIIPCRGSAKWPTDCCLWYWLLTHPHDPRPPLAPALYAPATKIGKKSTVTVTEVSKLYPQIQLYVPKCPQK